MKNAVKLQDIDNVAVGIEPLNKGDILYYRDQNDELQSCIIKESIPIYHKAALTPIQEGQPIIKYGECIGCATKNIQPGEHVHIHNVVSPEKKGGLL